MNWSSLSLAEQLGNIGSEFERAVRWKQENKTDLALKAAQRTLAQLDQTLLDHRHRGPRRAEIARLREEVCRELFSAQLNEPSAAQLQRYFFAFAQAARRHTG